MHSSSRLKAGVPDEGLRPVFPENPHYHAATDLPETLDYEFLAQVTQGVTAVVLAQAEPLMRGA